MKVLVAGMGNELRGDDGFGVAVMHLLVERDLGAEVTVKEFGMAGIHLVQELLTRYDGLLIVDAVRRDSAPGTLHLLEPEVADIADLPDDLRRDFLADLHWADPGRVLIFAKALGVLPPKVLILGCQPEDVEDLTMALTPAVAGSLPRALAAIDDALGRLTA